MDRRRSTRLSGENANGTIHMESQPEAEAAGEPVKKKQRTAGGVNVLKPPTRKGKAPAFKPTIAAATPFTEPSTDTTTTNGTKPPPPPPSERRPARRRSSAEALLKRLDGSPTEAIAQTTAAAAAAGKGKPRVSKAKPDRARSEPGEGLDGLGTSLEVELGRERGRWKDLVVQDPTPVKDGSTNQNEAELLDLLDFGEPERVLPSAPKPITPPRPAATTLPSTLYTTPSRRSRRLTVAPGNAADAAAAAAGEMIPLPIEDTPMIRRNQEMRERASRRRSSAGNRGARMSENLGRGDISVPHPAVPSEKWYKHIGASFPEPVRVQHLLLWGLKKAALEGEDAAQQQGEKSGRKGSRSKGKGKEKRTAEGDEIVREIVEAVTTQMARGEIDTNVFPLPGELKEEPGALRPHPRNVANREYQATTTDFINRQKAESAQWSGIINAANARRNDWLARWQERTAELEEERPAYELPDELPSRIPQLHEWSALVHEVLEDESEMPMVLDAEDIEIKIDLIHQNTYAATHFSAQATRFLDGIFAAFTQDLRNEDRIELATQSALVNTDTTTPVDAFASGSTGGARAKPRRDPMDLLRALAAAEATHQSEETLSAASALPMVPSATSVRATSNPSHLAMTPRRQAVMTPRRAPALGTTPRRLPVPSSAAKGNGAPAVSPSGRN
ncbi:hypothetical protein NCC49_003580 [Naganishia albida]|nr:hypothetical protein NCC49_003580 [Naganishia albida]